MNAFIKLFIIVITIASLFCIILPSKIEVMASTNNDLKFEHLSIDQGLSQSTVYSIIQDKYGYMWFGTKDGLNKYDGTKFIIYRYNPYDETSLSDSYIKTLYEDKNGVLWVGTNNGLNRFNRATDNFTRYLNEPDNPNSLSSNTVLSIYEDSENTLWIGTDNGLNILDRETGIFTSYLHQESNSDSISNNNIRAIYEDSHNILWIGTNYGLNVFDRETETFRSYTHQIDDSSSISSNNIRAICEDNNGILWIGTTSGLNKFNYEKETFTNYSYDPNNSTSISSNILYALCEDTEGYLWIGTNNGLNRFNRETETFDSYINDPDDMFSISDRSVWSICQDNCNNIWIGTLSGGLNKYNHRSDVFRNHQSQSYNTNCLSDNLVQSIVEDSLGNLWIGTSNGLNKYNYGTQEYTLVIVCVAFSLFEDANNNLWIGTSHGLIKYNLYTEEPTYYFHNSNNANSLSDNLVRFIYQDSTGFLWLATNYGLDKFDPVTETFINYYYDPSNKDSVSSSTIETILEDSYGYLWVGTNNGLNKYDPETGIFTRYFLDNNNSNSISSNAITYIYEDTNNILWIGTTYGLNKFDRDTENFTHYTTENGLRNNRINGILEDNDGNLWLGTYGGLSKFNPASELFSNYSKNDGIQGNEFYQGSCYKNEDGEMFFGGLNGLTSFDASEIETNTNVPVIVITDFLVNGNRINTSEPVEDIDEITLPYSNNTFLIDFAALDYSSTTDNKYAYMLEGFDKNWIYCDADGSFSKYTNISNGEYIFKVIASNNRGIQNEEGIYLKIVIETPFWKQLWFILLIIMAGIFCIFLLIKYRTRTLSKHAQDLELRVVERTSQLNDKSEQLENELNRRVTFTRVLVHELKTPLTPILTASEFLNNTMENNLSKEIIETIFLGASTLDKRIDELMDISRGEIGMLKFNFKDRDITTIIKEVKQYMSYVFIQKNQSFTVEMPDYIPKISINRERIRQVLVNILTNASKFTQKTGHIILRVTYDSDNVIIEIEDDGIGIPIDKQDDLFTFYEIFENREFPNVGTGIGLALSKIIVELHCGKIWGKNNRNGKGSTFGFSLPYIRDKNENINN